MIKKGDGTLLISKTEAYPGQLFLTNERLTFVRDHTKLLLFQHTLQETEGGGMFDLALNEIKEFSKSRFGLSRRVLKLNLHDGREFKVLLKERFSVWEEELKKVMNKQ